MRAHRGGHARAALALLESREHECHPLERQREGEHAAAVDGGRQVVGATSGRLGDLGQACVLDRVRREPIAAARPALGAAEREHPGVLARAVVLERRRLRPALELVLVRRRLREQAAHGGELLGPGEVGGGRDRDLLVGEVVARPHERERLERLGRRAQEGDEALSPASARRGRRSPRSRARGGATRRRCPRRTSTVIGSTARVYESGRI